MGKTVSIIRKIAIAVAGFTVLIVGIILIPAPGPGLLVVILGLLILSTEFEWAKKYLESARRQLESVKNKVKAQRRGKASTKDVDRAGDHKRKGKGRN